jgi:uncharacterized protein (DUF1800 family)
MSEAPLTREQAASIDCGVEAETVSDARTLSPLLSSASALPLVGLLAACGGGGGGSTPTPTPTPPPVVVVRKPQTDAEAARFALQAGIAVTEAEITSLKSVGYEPWLNTQMDAAISQTGTAWLAARGYSQVTADNFYDAEFPADYMIWNQLMTPANGVRKRVALALSEFFVVSLNSMAITWRSQAMAHYWDQLNSNAFGNFRQLLEDMTLNPAMGYYLSTRGNRKEDTRTGRQPDENYSREVMQLFTIGLFQLNNDGTNKLNASGLPIETYTNTDVTNLARVFTGYDFDYTGNVRTPAVSNPAQMINSPVYVQQAMTLDPTKWLPAQTASQHSTLEASFLGTTIAANTDGTAALRTALDTLFNHANVGPFFAKQMIQRLVTSNPSPAYVDRVARAFNNNGAGVRGDLRAVFKAILLDEDALGAAGLTSPTFGRVREPMLRLAQWAQTFGAASASGNWRITNLSDARNLGQSPLRSPSVFNFFRPGYIPANTAIATNSLVAPEFQLVNETTAPSYVNYMSGVISTTNGINNDVKATYAGELAIAHDAAALLDRVILLLAANQLSASSKATIRTALDAITVTQTSTDAIKLRRIHTAVLLVMAAPEYIVQR